MDNQIKRHPVHKVYDGVFNSNSGLIVDLLNPTADMISIVDIASALSKICRFGGHSNDFYSVAQHSVIVANMAPAYLCKEALLHDAAEAYLGDVIKPLKIILGDNYKQLEDRFMEAVIEKFSLSRERLAEVKAYDLEALTVEDEYFMGDCGSLWNATMSRINVNPHTWTHQQAFSKFMAFYRLFFEM